VRTIVAKAQELSRHVRCGKAIQNRGTLCGSLAHAHPAVELPAVALAVDAELSLTPPPGSDDRRRPEFSN
jgi:carbon-monoxide dehydrogenase medium subunit